MNSSIAGVKVKFAAARFLRVRPLTILLIVFVGCAQSPQVTTNTLLDSQQKSFIVIGYSTSYAWPDMLQEMLDEHSNGRRTYHVLDAVVGGSPVETWIAAPGSEDYEKTVGAMLAHFFGTNPRLRGQAPQASIVLCQQSLQFTRTRRGPIARPDDEVGIRIGADAMEKLAFAAKGARRRKSLLWNAYL